MNNLKIIPIKCFEDNYIWFIYADKFKICIDPGDSVPVLEFLNKNNIVLDQIWVTHGHFDHVGGVEDLINIFSDCRVIGPQNVPFVNVIVGEGFKFKLGDNFLVSVWHSPGHTKEHILFLLKNILDDKDPIRIFTGDTLFSAGAGKVLGGTIGQLKNSVDRINKLPSNTIIYPAHEYTKSNLEFSLFLEKDNQDINKHLKNIHIPSLPVTLSNERKINPFLRCNNADLINSVKKFFPQVDINDDLSIFSCIRELKNNFNSNKLR